MVAKINEIMRGLFKYSSMTHLSGKDTAEIKVSTEKFKSGLWRSIK